MPEASMDHNKGAVLRQDNIRPSLNIFSMESEAETKGVKPFSDKQFRAGILRPDTGHHPAACRRINNINHQASIWMPKAFMKTG
jgi:hypothetical protein